MMPHDKVAHSLVGPACGQPEGVLPSRYILGTWIVRIDTSRVSVNLLRAVVKEWTAAAIID